MVSPALRPAIGWLACPFLSRFVEKAASLEHDAREREVKMTRQYAKSLLWAPRILGIMFALFLSIFALDVFGQGYGFWGTALALFMHLIPTFVLLIALAMAWRWPWVGALTFIGFSLWYIIVMGARPWLVPIEIAGPPLLIGILFLVDWLYRPKLRIVH